MEKRRLLETLEELRAELSQDERVEPDTLATLRQFTDEIQQALDRQDAKAASELAPATSGLKDLLLKYESEHPQLSAAIGKVADALAAMGI